MRELSRWINLWVIAGAACIALVLLAVTLGALWATRPSQPAPGAATAVLNVIPYPTFTPTSLPPTLTPTPGPTADSQIPPSPPPGVISQGALVQISGTAGDGLRMRSEPGLEGVIRFLGLEAEVFQVEDGPVELDGYTWWYLVAPYDSSVAGWAVANYLTVVQNP